MKIVIIILAVLPLALFGFLCGPETNLAVSVSELDNGIKIENTGNVDCLVFVSSPEGEQRFELTIGQSLVIIGITKPIEVSAVKE